jgi:Mrp family chromosome partitioning ATPase
MATFLERSSKKNGTFGAPVPVVPTVIVDAFSLARARPSPAAADAFRTLALTVDRLLEESQLKSVAVMSARRGDGRSLTAELLALALSEIRAPVRLLDADPFDATVKDAVIALDLVDEPSSGPSYEVLTLGQSLFSNQRDYLSATKTLLHRANEGGATVVIDVPACEASSIGFSVARMASCALYVARPDQQESELHAQIRAQLDLLGVHLLGVVFNER